MGRSMKFILAAAALATGGVANAEETVLDTVIVKGQALDSANNPFSVTRIQNAEIREQEVSHPAGLLRLVPGMNWRALGLNGVADNISIRGFGAGGHGGDLGVAMDGIPLNEAMSHADGYADLNVIIPLEIDTLKVYRGPVTALYGNYNRGGTVELTSRRSGSYTDLDASVGTWHTADAQLAWGDKVGTGGTQVNLAGQVYHTNGFREQSEFDKANLSGRVTLPLAEHTDLAFAARIHRSTWNSASYITESEFDDPDRRFSKDPNVQNDGGTKHFYTARADLSQRLDPDLKLLVFGYGTKQDFTRFFTRPISLTTWRQREETYHRDVQGAGANLNGTHKWGDTPSNWVAGVEMFREETRFERYDALDHRAHTAPATHDRRYSFDSEAAFFQSEWTPSPLFRPSLGLRHDRFHGDCERVGAETSTDPCDRMNDYNHTSPKLGLRSSPSTTVELRASGAEGFALPGDAVKYGTGGDVEPSIFRQYEAGLQWKPLTNLIADVAAFRLDSSKEIAEYPAGSGTYENFGTTRREGIETDLHFYPSDGWDLSANYAVLSSEVRENISDALVGKAVPSVPRNTATLQVAHRDAGGLGERLSLRRVGSYYLDTANTYSYDGFTVLDLNVSYETKTAAGKSLRYYVTIENLADKAYVTAASLIGDQVVYAPGAPRHLTAGISASF
jgi:iron complex outermembrane recepter protein